VEVPLQGPRQGVDVISVRGEGVHLSRQRQRHQVVQSAGGGIECCGYIVAMTVTVALPVTRRYET
jgi:hypothetical protein